MAYMVVFAWNVVIMMKFTSEIQIAIVIAIMTKSNTELRYDRLLREFAELEKKMQRKIKQLIVFRAKLGIPEEK